MALKTETKQERILIVRPDRIGDVVLSTPVILELSKQRPNAELWALVRPEIKPILFQPGSSVGGLMGVIEYDPEERHRGVLGWLRLLNAIREQDFSTAIVLRNKAFVSSAVYAAGIPVRVGPISHPDSRIWFNRGVRQHRSKVRTHEAQYNLELLRAIGIEPSFQKGNLGVASDLVAMNRISKWLEKIGVSEKPFVLLHPGMRGSAPNWARENYEYVVRGLKKEGILCVLSQGPGDVDVTSWEEPPHSHVYHGEEWKGLSNLVALIDRSALVVAPSTGPLHIATALRKKTVSFFPPRVSPYEVMSADRWGPWVTQGSDVFVAKSVEKNLLVGVNPEDILARVKSLMGRSR